MPKVDDLFRLRRQASGGNYSADEGNFNHFVNVVSALARLIAYFSKADHLCERLHSQEAKYSHLAFNEAPSLRTFKLMLGGFYHDLGKTVTDPRHAVEGAIILGYHTTSARYQLHRIARKYRDDYRFEREDFLYIAALVLFHDHFGTLSTGEDGYMALVQIIDRIKRYSLKGNPDEETQIECTRRYLFDLWLLNVADIMVSLDYRCEWDGKLESKWVLQDSWTNPDRAKSRIEDFLEDPKGGRLVHDLKITFNLLDIVKKHKHSDDLTEIESAAHDCSKRHVIERLRRLMVSALAVPLAKILSNKPGESEESPEQRRYAIAAELKRLDDEDWHPIIVRAIQSVSYRGDFITRLSWIGKMDYALGFFQQLAEGAMAMVLQELKDGHRTGWLRANDDGVDDKDYYYRVQAEFFADNFVATVVGILTYVLFREPSIDRLRNIEFSDAKKRLTPHKIEQLLAQEGPFRTRRSVEATMQTIYFY